MIQTECFLFIITDLSATPSGKNKGDLHVAPNIQVIALIPGKERSLYLCKTNKGMGSAACVGIQSDFDVEKNVNSFSLSSSSPRFLASVSNKAFFSFPYVSE